MSEYRIASCEVRDIEDGMLVEPTFFKVFLVTPEGDWGFEMEFDNMEDAEAYIELSEKYPKKSSLEKALMVEKGEM